MTNTAHLSPTVPCPPAARGRLHRRRWFTVLAAMAAGTAAWTVAGPLLGVDLVVRSGGHLQHVGQLAVVLTGLVAGLVAWGVLALLERFTSHARGLWRALAAVVLVLSLAGPLGAVTTSATVALVVLHLVVGGVLIVALPGGGRARRA